MSTKPIEWKRLFTEGIVILVSILLAFSIDAWWSERQQYREAESQVDRVLTEMRANLAILKAQDGYLDGAIEGARELLILCGPDPVPTKPSKLAALVGRIYGVPVLSLERSASDEFLSSGHLTIGLGSELRNSLSYTLSNVRISENSSLELRAMRPEMVRHMQSHFSGLDLVRGHELMQDYPSSRFVSDSQSLLSDMYFEGLIANYTIRMEINRRSIENLSKRYESLIAEVEA